MHHDCWDCLAQAQAIVRGDRRFQLQRWRRRSFLAVVSQKRKSQDAAARPPGYTLGNAGGRQVAEMDGSIPQNETDRPILHTCSNGSRYVSLSLHLPGEEGHIDLLSLSLAAKKVFSTIRDFVFIQEALFFVRNATLAGLLYNLS